MNPIIQRAARPITRRILLAGTSSSTTVPARWQSNNSGPYDPVVQGELAVGELEGAKFRIEPLRRTGEDPTTMRARLTYQSRKRGTLESDLLLSTFAAQHLPTMTPAQMSEYDLLLDENDWDIYYWATQSEEQGVPEVAANNGGEQGGEVAKKSGPVAPAKGEWAQTVGTFKPAYRPVPARWKNSEILGMLRAHVKERSAAGVLGNGRERETAEGMAFMPALGARK